MVKMDVCMILSFLSLLTVCQSYRSDVRTKLKVCATDSNSRLESAPLFPERLGNADPKWLGK